MHPKRCGVLSRAVDDDTHDFGLAHATRDSGLAHGPGLAHTLVQPGVAHPDPHPDTDASETHASDTDTSDTDTSGLDPDADASRPDATSGHFLP